MADEAIGPSGAPPLSRPRHEKWLPWAVAVGANLGFFLVFGLVARVTIAPGIQDPETILPVIVLAEDDLLPAPEEQDEDFTRIEPEQPDPAEPGPVTEPPAEEQRPDDPPAASAPAETAEPLEEEQPVPEPRVAPAAPARAATVLPEVDLPDAQAGGPQGIIALRCQELFDDPDKILECAGRPEILSGWTRDGADFSDIVDALRRGGVMASEDVPLYGPSSPGLPRGTEAYEPFDDGLLLGRDTARAIRNYQRFEAMKDERSKISEMQSPVDNQFSNLGDGGTVPLFLERWEPSWVLKDQPNVDRKVIDEMIRDAEQGGDD